MPPGRPKKDVESYKELILHLHSQGIEYKEILQRVSTQRGLGISEKVLRNNLKAWGKTRYDKPECRDETLRDALIATLFLQQNANDKIIMLVLESKDLRVTSDKLQRLRVAMGLRRKRPLKDACSQDEEIIRIEKEHLD